ncbi:MAG TPA: hypothetical protein VIV40_03615 [Kofleriaceae bacterium]
MKLVIACVLVLGACKKAEKAPESSPVPSVARQDAMAVGDAGQATAAAPQPCPTAAALKEATAKALAVKAEAVSEVTCNAIATPKQLWAIDAIKTSPSGNDEGALLLLDARDGSLVSKDSTGESDRGLAKATIEVADLDGDGAEELLRSATAGANGFASETLHVLAARGDKLVEVGKLPVRSENTGAVSIGMAKPKEHYECQSTRKVIAGPTGKKLIEIVADKRKGKPPADECPPVGRHVYSFNGKAVVETKDAAKP